MSFLEQKPSYVKRQVHKAGSNWRKGEPYDEELIDDFLVHHAVLSEEITTVAMETISSLLIPVENVGDAPVKPDSGSYNLTARVKTRPTLLQKLRRMPTFPLENIQDIAGIRFDCDLTLTEQSGIVDAFKLDLINAGATKVDIRDMREEPHSGYRAVHLHIFSEAGRAELQIRTAMQAKWANLYEEAADIYGRDIRYLELGKAVPAVAREEIGLLHEASDVVYETELLLDRITSDRTLSPEIGTPRDEIKRIRRRSYGILEDAHSRLSEAREKMMADRKGE